MDDIQNFKSGYVTIIGAPNVGKSTLLNAILGQKLAIVTPKPQTTRNQIRGILTTDTHQIIFVDTPGLMNPKYRLQTEMVKTAYGALGDADVVLFVVDVTRQNSDIEDTILKRLKRVKTTTILVLNKVDVIEKRALLPIFEDYSQKFEFAHIIPISALTTDGIPVLLEQIETYLPLGPRYFPEDQLSDLPERFFIAETVREKIMLMTQREIPYASAVVVEEFEKRQTNKSGEILYIRAIVYAERQTQKQIIIGKGGKLIKRVGELARIDIEKFLDTRVFLELYVTVKADWRRDARKLKELGGFADM
ncbi:GTPase Era [Candidatus Poribacteria bacterium]|nr:GTPase Era [Candidatus Poribacteria bacterium]MYA70638.1 GTPase Era [Candidatus Poribacteria bacterium]MYH83154.1 GTPase Era [Candidatus Poribacteria bacterium]